MCQVRVVVVWAIVVGMAGPLDCEVLAGQGDTEVTQQTSSADEKPALEALTIRIVQDNYSCSDRLEAAWGFAAHLTGPQENILFDTGSDGALLLGNMAKMGLDPNRVETVVLSHNHADHTGGLIGLLQQNADITLYGLKSFPAQFQQTVRGYGARFVGVSRPQPICENVTSTGQVGTRIREQALIVRTKRGLVVLTGCAHPGVVRMVEKVKAQHEEEILLVMGGFHLGWAQAGEIEQIIGALKDLGVRYAAPTHCSGDKARALFKQHFGAQYLEVGVGKTIDLTELK